MVCSNFHLIFYITIHNSIDHLIDQRGTFLDAQLSVKQHRRQWAAETSVAETEPSNSSKIRLYVL